MLPSSTVVNWLDWQTEYSTIRTLMLTTEKSLYHCHLTRFFSIYSITIDKLSKPMLPSSTVQCSSQLILLTNRVLHDSEPNADYLPGNYSTTAIWRDFFNLFKYRHKLSNPCYKVVNWLIDDWNVKLTTGKSLNCCHLTRFFQSIQLDKFYSS